MNDLATYLLVLIMGFFDPQLEPSSDDPVDISLWARQVYKGRDNCVAVANAISKRLVKAGIKHEKIVLDKVDRGRAHMFIKIGDKAYDNGFFAEQGYFDYSDIDGRYKVLYRSRHG